MSGYERRLLMLTRHINHVRENCDKLADYFIENNEMDMARQIIHNGYVHDSSKFQGIEWDHLFDPEDPLFPEALKHHVESKSNRHHSEAWNSIHEMDRLHIAEMVADWISRSNEFGSSFEYWLNHTATKKYKFNKYSEVYRMIEEFSAHILEKKFV